MHQMKIYFWSSSGVIMVANGLQLPEGGDFHHKC